MDTQLNEPSKDGGFSTASKPFTAFIAGARFLINLEETRHLFTLFDAVDGKQNERNYQRFLNSDIGAAIDRDCVNIADILADEETLRAYPKGSSASAFLDFLSTENLRNELLMIAEQDAQISTLDLDPSRRNYMASGFAVHDLLHVVTGYGREPIGEACILQYTAEQLQFRGIGLFAHALSLREQASHPGIPVLKIMKEARAIGRKATWMPEIDWRDLLGLPLDEARAKIGLETPTLYNSYKDRMSSAADTPRADQQLKHAA